MAASRCGRVGQCPSLPFRDVVFPAVAAADRMHRDLPSSFADPDYCVVARRNDSLGRARRWSLFGALAGVSLLVAAGCAAVGAWPVLPFSVVEIALLAGAFLWIDRHAGDWERLVVVGDRVIVERRQGRRQGRREFNRCWLRVELKAAAFERSPKLTLNGAGVSLPFGETLAVPERLAVARELRRLTARR